MRHIASPHGKYESKNMASPNVAPTDNSSGGVGNSAPSSPTPEWSGDPVLLKDFANKRKVPGFARVVKGSYMTIGSSKFSLSKQHHDLYIHSVKVGVKVLAHCLKRVELPGRRGQQFTRLYSIEQRLAIPISYQGWFELLSEDGKASKPIASVPELAKEFPKRCVVRENMKAYLSTGEGRPTTFDKTKIIPAGEQLVLTGVMELPAPSDNVKVKLLQCRDTKDDNVYLSFDQKGVFTPVAGESDFTGVFNIRDIVRRFRLPLTVKLAHGVRPRVDPNKFTGIIRLDWVYTEETAFVCPLEKNHVRLMPMPTDVHLQLVVADNQEELMNSELCRSIQAKCTRMVSNYNNTLHLIVTVPESVTKVQHRNSRASNIFSAPLQPSPISTPSARGQRRSKSREDMLMAEIDDLYGYVRDGGAPPKSKFQYDSDEESYWEEPAYEPLDEFRARLKAIEAGQTVNFPPQYKPADPGQLKGLVAEGDGPAGVPPVTASGPGGAAGVGENSSAGMYGVVATGPSDESSSSTATLEPPPLPPRPPEMASAAAAVDTPSAPTPYSITTTTPPHRQSLPAALVQSTQARRRSVPLPINTATFTTTSTQPPSTDTPTTPTATTPTTPTRRVSRSDSVPEAFPTSSSAARPPLANRQSKSPGDAKLDWKERLRQFNNLGDKEGSSSASSGSAPGNKGGNRLARDFRDSDISSRTKTSSDSSGNARKRMQTLYL